jgi:hypothetical protein
VDRKVQAQSTARTPFTGGISGDNICGGADIFAPTVGAVDEKTVQEYIEKQKWDHDADGFKITAPTEA